MKKQYRIVLVANILLIPQCVSLIGQLVYVFPYLEEIQAWVTEYLKASILSLLYTGAFVAFPWVMARRSKRGILLTSLVLMISTCDSSSRIVDIVNAISSGQLIEVSLLDKVRAILGYTRNLQFFVFGLLVIIFLYKPYKLHILYVIPVLALILDAYEFIVGNMNGGGIFSDGYLWDWIAYRGLFDSIILIASVYLYSYDSSKHTYIATKVKGFLSNDNSAGYAYLDEYKKNMKK